jgi:hypothetical protein
LMASFLLAVLLNKQLAQDQKFARVPVREAGIEFLLRQRRSKEAARRFINVTNPAASNSVATPINIDLNWTATLNKKRFKKASNAQEVSVDVKSVSRTSGLWWR